jgi:hypothetical protein
MQKNSLNTYIYKNYKLGWLIYIFKHVPVADPGILKVRNMNKQKY